MRVGVESIPSEAFRLHFVAYDCFLFGRGVWVLRGLAAAFDNCLLSTGSENADELM